MQIRRRYNMIKVSIKLDKRRRLKNGKYPLKFKIARKDGAIYIPTGYELKEEEWDAENERVKSLADRRIINIKLGSQLAILNDKIMTLQQEGKMRFYSNKKLLLYLSNKGTENENVQRLFKTQYEAFVATKENATTIDIYKNVTNKIKEYCDYESLELRDIDIDWLNGYTEKLRQDRNCTNSIAINLRCIRAVLNFARKRGVIKEYVFSMYKIKTEETRKRSLTVEQLRTLYRADLSKIRSKHRDMFFLIFFLMGINMIDLSRLTKIENGRITYRRAKTGTLYDIKVEPEAMAIIDKYRGKEHLLKVFDKLTSYKYYEVALNDTLSKICAELELPKISAYWARHTFATIAYEIGIPTDTIADCLGHKSTHKITEIYIKKDLNKIDEANRKVIDYVLYNIK